MQFLPGPGTVNIFIRNMRLSGLSNQEIAAKMKRRLELGRFDVTKLDAAMREKYLRLKQLIDQLEETP